MTWSAKVYTSTWARPHDGQETISSRRWRRFSDSRIASPTLTSSTGGADSDTRIVSPIPSRQQGAECDRGLDRALECRPGLGDAEMQRVVARCGEQLVGPHHDDRVVVLDRDLEVAEVVLLEQRRLPQRRLDERLRGGLAVLGEQPLVERSRVDPDSDRTCRRPAAALAISPTLSSNALMLPGLTRTAAQPASIAANTYLGWKWMSAITGIWDFFAIAGNASASSCDGTATRTMSQPAAVSSAICCNVASTSAVSVVVIDCTETGASPPTSDRADLDLAGRLGAARERAAGESACRGKLSSRDQYPHSSEADVVTHPG